MSVEWSNPNWGQAGYNVHESENGSYSSPLDTKPDQS